MVDGSNGEVRIVDRATNETLGRFGRVGRQAGGVGRARGPIVGQAR
jgi:hypothetical protein